MFATASTVVRWLLVEQPGPWGADAVPQSRLPHVVSATLVERAVAHRVRVVLIRRPGRHVPDGIQVYAAHAGADRPWLEHVHLPEAGALLELDLSRLARGEPLGAGTLQTEPVHLVCTNGRHDTCCSERARPVAAALRHRFGDRAWEVSHIGGDRFAPTVVCLPAGVYLGRVDPEVAVGVVERFEDGRLDLARYRGRCAYDFPTQAAEFFLRERLGLDGLADLRLVDRRRPRRGLVTARFEAGTATHTVTVAVERAAGERPLTCRVDAAVRPPAYRLVSMEEVPPPN
ncbi:MAG TPA: sucrase ferredoxin [Actinomycetota bacterium]